MTKKTKTQKEVKKVAVSNTNKDNSKEKQFKTLAKEQGLNKGITNKLSLKGLDEVIQAFKLSIEGMQENSDKLRLNLEKQLKKRGKTSTEKDENFSLKVNRCLSALIALQTKLSLSTVNERLSRLLEDRNKAFICSYFSINEQDFIKGNHLHFTKKKAE